MFYDPPEPDAHKLTPEALYIKPRYDQSEHADTLRKIIAGHIRDIEHLTHRAMSIINSGEYGRDDKDLALMALQEIARSLNKRST